MRVCGDQANSMARRTSTAACQIGTNIYLQNGVRSCSDGIIVKRRILSQLKRRFATYIWLDPFLRRDVFKRICFNSVLRIRNARYK